MPQQVKVKVNHPQDQVLSCAFAGDYEIEGNFKFWIKNHHIKKLDFKLKKKSLGVLYDFFLVNQCGPQHIEMHVAVVDSNENISESLTVGNPGIDLSLDPGSKNNGKDVVKITIWEYDISKRPEDLFLYKCGIRTNIKIPPYDNDRNNYSFDQITSVDPQPEKKGESILIGNR